MKDNIVKMLSGVPVPIQTRTFKNDMANFASADDILTLLVHLGYLSYDEKAESVSIPNREVSMEYVDTISTMPESITLLFVNCLPEKDLLIL